MNKINPSIGLDYAAVSATYGSTVIKDPYPMFRDFRRTMPVMEGDILAKYGVPSQADYAGSGRKVYTLFRHGDITAILRDPLNFSCRLLNEGQSVFWGEDIWTADDGPAHRAVRMMLQAAFVPAVLKRWQASAIIPTIRDSFIKPLAPNGSAELVSEFALPFPVRVIYSFLGFPDDAEAQENFATWALRILGGAQVDPERAKTAGPLAFQAAHDLYDHIHKIVAQRRAAGSAGDDFMGFLLRAEQTGNKLDDGRITSLIRLLLPAAAETTTRSFTNMMVLLLQRPEVLARIRADRSLVPAAVHESMRFEPTAAFLARLVEQDVEIGGVKIPAGAALSMATGSANRDEDVYEDGEAFNIGRPMKPNFGFGFGVHLCLGQQIAKMELEAALEAVLDFMPKIRFDPRHPEPEIRGMTLRGPDQLHVVWG